MFLLLLKYFVTQFLAFKFISLSKILNDELRNRDIKIYRFGIFLFRTWIKNKEI